MVQYSTRKYNTWKLDLFLPSGEGLTLALSKGPNRIGVFPPHLTMERDPVSETLCFLVSRIPNDEKSPKAQ
jgi:hypothetical protein